MVFIQQPPCRVDGDVVADRRQVAVVANHVFVVVAACTAIIPQHNDPMHMVRHDNELIQLDMRTMNRQFVPCALHHHPRRIQSHPPIHHLAKPKFTPMRTNRHEIRTVRGLIVIGQTDGMAAVRHEPLRGWHGIKSQERTITFTTVTTLSHRTITLEGQFRNCPYAARCRGRICPPLNNTGGAFAPPASALTRILRQNYLMWQATHSAELLLAMRRNGAAVLSCTSWQEEHHTMSEPP